MEGAVREMYGNPQFIMGLFVLLGAIAAQGQPVPTSRPVNDRLEAVRRKAAAGRLEREITTAWYRRIEGIVRLSLSRDDSAARAKGRRRLAAIRDPLALMPLIRILGRSDEPSVRVALAEHLSRFGKDEAVLQLTVMCLSDPDAGVRAAATRQLGCQDDARVFELLRLALRSGHEAFVVWSADAFRLLGRFEAGEALIGSLVATSVSNGNGIKAVKGFMESWRKMWPHVTAPQLAPRAAMPTSPHLRGALRWLKRARSNKPAPVTVEPSVFRTAVLEALRSLTKVDFGFDQRRWRRWWKQEQKRRKLLPKLGE